MSYTILYDYVPAVQYAACAPWACVATHNGQRMMGSVVGEQRLAKLVMKYHALLEDAAGRLHSVYVLPTDVLPMPANVVRPIVAQWRARPVETKPDGTQPS